MIRGGPQAIGMAIVAVVAAGCSGEEAPTSPNFENAEAKLAVTGELQIGACDNFNGFDPNDPGCDFSFTFRNTGNACAEDVRFWLNLFAGNRELWDHFFHVDIGSCPDGRGRDCKNIITGDYATLVCNESSGWCSFTFPPGGSATFRAIDPQGVSGGPPESVVAIADRFSVEFDQWDEPRGTDRCPF